MFLQLVALVTDTERFAGLCRLFTHSPFTSLSLRAVNDSSFEFLYRSLQVTVRSFKATDFCFFALLYWF